MVKVCETLNQEQAVVCPGLDLVMQANEVHFTELGKNLKTDIEDAFKVKIEQATGFSWSERAKLKCILGWAKKAKDEDNRVKIWVWAVGASVLSSLLTWFLKGLTP